MIFTNNSPHFTVLCNCNVALTVFSRAAELRAECSQEAAVHSDIMVATLTEELSALREELDTRTALGKR